MSARNTSAGTRRRPSDTLGYLPPVRGPRFWPKVARRLLVTTGLVAWVAGLAVAATSLVEIDALGGRTWVPRAGAAVLMVVYACALTYRCGGRLRVWPLLAVLAAALALALDLSWLVSTTSVVTAVLAAVLAIMLTRPAGTTIAVVVEYLVAVVVAVSGTIAVAAWDAPIVYFRYSLTVLALSLAGALLVVWGLGARLHGIGRRGAVLVIAAAVAMALILAYGTAVRAYGSPQVVERIDAVVTWLREHIGGVPRPAEALVGFPALVWGIGTRADRRQGWWMCAFGVIGTAVLTTSLASPMAIPSYVGLSTLYSVVLGLMLGLLLRRFDSATPSGGGRRARREEPVTLARPEPSRFAPLT